MSLSCATVGIGQNVAPVYFRIHAITETWQEGKDVVQGLFDSGTEGCDVVCLQKCNTWLPLTQDPRYIGQGEEVSSKSNNLPEHGRNGSVCELRAKKNDTMARQSLVKNIQPPAGDSGPKGTSNDNNKTTPQEENTQQEIIQKIQECEEHIKRVMAVLEAMDVEHPNYHNEYLSLYEQTLQESGIKQDRNDPNCILHYLHHAPVSQATDSSSTPGPISK